MLWLNVLSTGASMTEAAPDAAHATSSLLCALVELLPTAARRASGGSAPHASARLVLYGLVDGRGTRAAPHVLATAPLFTMKVCWT